MAAGSGSFTVVDFVARLMERSEHGRHHGSFASSTEALWAH